MTGYLKVLLIPMILLILFPAPGFSAVTGEELLGRGWEAFNTADYPVARDYFQRAVPLLQNSDEGLFGLALCKLVQGDLKGAREGYRFLVEQHFRLSETLPQYLQLAVDSGAEAEAMQLLDAVDFIPEVEQSKPGVRKAGMFVTYLRAVESGTLDDDLDFVSAFDHELQACHYQNLFRRLADNLGQQGWKDIARSLYLRLFQCSSDPGERTGLLFGLKAYLSPDELLPLIDGQVASLPADNPNRRSLQELQKELLYRSLSDEPEHTREVAEAILAIDPLDGVAHRALGWELLQLKEFDTSYSHFSAAESAQGPDDELTEGKVYALSGAGKFVEALAVARSQSGNPKMEEIADQIEERLLWQKLQSLPDDADERGPIADAIVKLAPDDAGIRNLRGWWFFNRHAYEAAREDFLHILVANPHDHDAAFGAAMAHRRLGQDEDALAIADDHQSEDQRLKSMARDILAERGWKAYDTGDHVRAKEYANSLLALDSDDRDGRGIRQALQGGGSDGGGIPVAYPGYFYLDLYQALKGGGGLGGSLLLHQGIDWIKTGQYSFLNTYLFYQHQTRTSDTRYFDETGGGGGIMIRGRVSKLGLEYASKETIRTRDHHDGWVAYLEWYANDLIPRTEKSYDGLTWATYGRVEYDLADRYGMSISSFVNGGIDWFDVAGKTPLNTYVEIRLHAREKESGYFNSWGPVIGVEGRRGDLRIGIEHAWLYWTERSVRENTAGIYLRWYYDWDLMRR